MSLSWLKNLGTRFSLPSLRKKMEPLPMDIMDASSEDNTPWWGHFLIAAEQSRYSKIGNTVLCIDHYNQEWKLAIRQEHLGRENPTKILGSYLQQDEIKLKPVLADRNLQVKLNCPFYIAGGEALIIYINSPSWIRIEIGNPSILLDEIPTEILADTWSGDNTINGDLCYAATHLATPRFEEIPQNTTQVTTPILLQNFSKDRIYVNELKIPLPFLSVYSDIHNHLWTEQVLLSFDHDSEPRTTITQGYPKHLQGPNFLSPARIPIKNSFKNIFGGGRTST